MLSAHATGAGGRGLDSRAGQIDTSTQCRQRLATAATFLRNCVAYCVAQALSRGDGPRYSLHASAYEREYNEDLILTFLGSEVAY